MSIHSCASNRPGHEAHVWAVQLTIVFLVTALKLQCNLEHVFNWPIVSEISMSRASHACATKIGLPLVKPTWRGVAAGQAYTQHAHTSSAHGDFRYNRAILNTCSRVSYSFKVVAKKIIVSCIAHTCASWPGLLNAHEWMLMLPGFSHSKRKTCPSAALPAWLGINE